jgi:hypothetical protein
VCAREISVVGELIQLCWSFFVCVQFVNEEEALFERQVTDRFRLTTRTDQKNCVTMTSIVSRINSSRILLEEVGWLTLRYMRHKHLSNKYLVHVVYSRTCLI